MADCKAENERRCCLVLVIVQRIMPKKSGLREGQAVETSPSMGSTVPGRRRRRGTAFFS
jgi:hypothetical protein